MKRSQLQTNLPALSVLSKRCRDMERHEHTVALEGTITLELDGKPRTLWKTMFAGHYAPALCRSWARVLRQVAPESAKNRHGDQEAGMHAFQQWMMDATGKRTPKMEIPRCPASFTTGWEGAVKEWSHKGSSRREAKGRGRVLKRPAAVLGVQGQLATSPL